MFVTLTVKPLDDSSLIPVVKSMLKLGVCSSYILKLSLSTIGISDGVAVECDTRVKVTNLVTSVSVPADANV